MCHKKNHLKRREGYLAILEMDSFNNSVDALQRLLSTGQSSHFGIKFVHSNKETLSLSTKEDNGSKESKEPDYDGDKEQLEEKQGEQTGEQQTTNRARQSQYSLSKYY